MTRAHTPNIAVLAVVLTVLTMAIAPMAVAGTPGETTTGTTIGDQLDDTSSSSADDGGASTHDSSTDDGASTRDSSTDDSSTDDGASTHDSSTDDSSTDDTSSGSSTNDSAEGSSEETNYDHTDLVESNVTDPTEQLLSAGVTGDLSTTTDVTGALPDATPTDSTTSSPDGGDASPFQRLETDVIEASTATTDDVSTTVDLDSQTLLSETQFVLGAVGVPSTRSSESGGVDAERLEPVPAATQSYETDGIDGIPPDGSTPLPPGPTTGLALGVGALAAAGVGRNGAMAPTLLATLSSSFGSALTAGLAPIAGRAGVFDRLFRMLAPFRYSRYDDSDPLEHDARADVYEVVNEAPGAYLSEVAEEADLPLSTARHHIRVLEREDLVSGAKVRGKRRFYPAYTQGIELAAALNDEATAAVIDAVSRLGASSVSDLADELGRDPSTVSHHLKRLAEDGIVVRERDGRAVMNRLSAEARTALDPGTESPATDAGEAMASD